MAQKLYEESNIQAIADAIRAKNGTTTTYKTNEMAAAIQAIEAGESYFGTEFRIYSGSYTPTVNSNSIAMTDVPNYFENSLFAILIWANSNTDRGAIRCVVGKNNAESYGVSNEFTGVKTYIQTTPTFSSAGGYVYVFSNDSAFVFAQNIEYKYLCILTT